MAGWTTWRDGFIDAVLALPLVIVALLALAAVGASNGTVILVIGITFTPITARTVCAPPCSRNAISTTCWRRNCVARMRFYIMFAEILPNVLQPIIVEATVRLGYAIFAVATAVLSRLRHPATVGRLGTGFVRELHVDGGRRVVDRGFRCRRHRLAGGWREPRGGWH